MPERDVPNSRRGDARASFPMRRAHSMRNSGQRSQAIMLRSSAAMELLAETGESKFDEGRVRDDTDGGGKI